MAFDDPGWQLLDDFFLGEAMGRAPSTARRYTRVRNRLTHYLDTADLSDWLGTHPATLLAAEREFHEHGAFWQLFGPDELVCCLPGLLLDPWLPDGAGEARTQISLVGRLLTHLSRRKLLDLSIVRCALWDAEAAVVQARCDLPSRSLEQEPDPWATTMPERFERRPGPQW